MEKRKKIIASSIAILVVIILILSVIFVLPKYTGNGNSFLINAKDIDSEEYFSDKYSEALSKEGINISPDLSNEEFSNGCVRYQYLCHKPIIEGIDSRYIYYDVNDDLSYKIPRGDLANIVKEINDTYKGWTDGLTLSTAIDAGTYAASNLTSKGGDIKSKRIYLAFKKPHTEFDEMPFFTNTAFYEFYDGTSFEFRYNPLYEDGLRIDEENVTLEKVLVTNLEPGHGEVMYTMQFNGDWTIDRKPEMFNYISWLWDEGETKNVTFSICFEELSNQGHHIDITDIAILDVK